VPARLTRVNHSLRSLNWAGCLSESFGGVEGALGRVGVSMKLRSFVTAVAMMAGVFFSTFAVVAPAHSGIVTIELIGNGSGSLGASGFSGSNFLFFLQGPDGNSGNGISLTTETVTIDSLGITSAFSGTSIPTFANLDAILQLAFLTTNAANGGISDAVSDLAQIGFNTSDFNTLQNSNVFSGVPTSLSFNPIQTTNGTLIFGDTTPIIFTAFSNGNFASAVPELSTWAMMLIGFAGIGFVAHRRAMKSSAAAAVA
jgi:hypothetical protein